MVSNEQENYLESSKIFIIFYILALIYSEDPEKIEISLKSVEKLCDSFHYELEEV